MIQITSPVAASRKWLRIRGGRIRLPPAPSCRIPPRDSQIASRTNPPPAVATQAINAAHSIRSLLLEPVAYPTSRLPRKRTTNHFRQTVFLAEAGLCSPEPQLRE